MPVATSSSFVFFSLDEAGVGDLFFFDDESRDARGTMVVLLVLGTRIIIIIARRVLRLLLLLLLPLLSGGRIFLRYKQRNWRSCIFKRYKKIRALFKRKKRRYARKTRPIRIRAPLVFGLLPLLVRRETVRFVLQNGRHEKTIRHPLLE